MGNDKPLKVDDFVVTPEGLVYQIKAIDGDMLVLQGAVTNVGALLVELQKISTAFVNTLKGTP